MLLNVSVTLFCPKLVISKSLNYLKKREHEYHTEYVCIYSLKIISIYSSRKNCIFIMSSILDAVHFISDDVKKFHVIQFSAKMTISFIHPYYMLDEVKWFKRFVLNFIIIWLMKPYFRYTNEGNVHFSVRCVKTFR